MRLIRQRFELNGIETYRSWINKRARKTELVPGTTVRYAYADLGLGHTVSEEELISHRH